MSAEKPPDLDRLIHRAITEDVRDTVERIAALETRVGDLSQQLEASMRELADSAAQRHAEFDRLIAQARLDRQVRSFARPLVDVARRVRRLRPLVLVVCPAYPDGRGSYGGQFVRARVRRYADYGVSAIVYVADARASSKIERGSLDGVPVWRGSIEQLGEVIRTSNPDVLGVHHPEPGTWPTIAQLPTSLPLVVWIHGFEARSWRDLSFNYLTPSRALRRRMDALDVERRSTIADVFDRANTDVVFVSAFMRGVAENFAQAQPHHGYVIPNLVDPDVFAYRKKQSEDRHSVLWIRSFARRNYANDLARDAILELSATDRFDAFSFTVIGEGSLFEESVEPLREFSNVTIDRRFVEQDEIPALHRRHGVILAPSRWDSQGLTTQEAMSSGLVAVTTKTAAIPEFLNETTAYLCPEENSSALAAALVDIDAQPDRYLSMSAGASADIQAICGPEATVEREADLLWAAKPIVSRPRR